MSFAHNLKMERKKAGIAQKDLAEVVGVDRTSISAYERGKTKPYIDTAFKIAWALRVPIDDLVRER